MTLADTFGTDNRGDLLRRAVHRHRAFSVEGLRERLFTYAFTKLVYAQIWEDPIVDLEALQLTPDSRVVTIASGGCNVMSYLTGSPAHIYAVDLNATHLALLKLKLTAAQRLPNHGAFTQFFGAAKHAANVANFETCLRPHLDAPTLSYWNGRDELGRRRITRFARGFHRYGMLGRFIGMAHVLAKLQGADPRKLLKARTRAEQRLIFEAELAPLFDRPFMRRLLDNPVSLFGLGIPPAQYDALCAEPGKSSAVVLERLRRLACDFDIHDNYFAWQAFNRGYARDGAGPLPPYLQAQHFEAVKNGASRVSVEQTNFIAFLSRQGDQTLDRYVLLDAQDWMSDQDLGALWSEIGRTARAGARVIFRTAAPESPLPGRVPAHLLTRWHYDAERSRALHQRDRSAIYGGFHLYVLRESAA